ncbi:hypothetical protein Ahy_B05g075603 [Arachis hypogaea]|uniref:Uncharacterized protein n=1 Tax=Arachis hypogaea TaxID=3818 RepID=A0A444Z1I9_ARAHY|nr:hypothetical protein Ahy_B05g075603 [Arachis hypogaea]
MDQYRINSWEDIGKIDFSSLCMENICQLHFADLGLAFEFYNSYAKTRGFSVRKSRSRIVDGKVREKTYVCSCEGYRLEKWNHMKNRVREPKPETRCGCMSKLHVIFNACDGRCQLDYDMFGDVLAFDATYKKNRYRLPVVIFSGVNHHNQTVVFGAALVSNERKSTYVWLLKQLLIAMKGKTPTSVITDGHPSMALAIQEVFPNAHHRLCAWHLMHNATSNIHKPQFTKMFTKLMLGDYEVGVFEQKWEEMVGFFGVEDREWIVDMYGKRNMWATAHIRGKFFVGFRTTSRCESLHAVLKRYVKSRHNLTEFVQHFQRCLSYMRHREDLADFKSSTGQPVMQTHFQQLERAHSGDNNMMEGHAEYMYEDLVKNGSTEIETTRKPKHCSYCRKGGHNIVTCSMRKMDERTPQFDDDAEENIEGEDYSFVDAESDEYVHTEWFEEEDVRILDSSRYYEQSGGETDSMDYDSGGANDDDEAEL